MEAVVCWKGGWELWVCNGEMKEDVVAARTFIGACH